MGLTRRKHSYYVVFFVLDDGETLKLASGGQLKRWKVGSPNMTVAKPQEALIRTDLMKGLVRSDQARPLTFNEWGEAYLQLEEVTRLRSYRDRVNVVRLQLIPFFGKKVLSEITPRM